MRNAAACNHEQSFNFYCKCKELICTQDSGSIGPYTTSADVIFFPENEIDGFELFWSDLLFELVKDFV